MHSHDFNCDKSKFLLCYICWTFFIFNKYFFGTTFIKRLKDMCMAFISVCVCVLLFFFVVQLIRQVIYQSISGNVSGKINEKYTFQNHTKKRSEQAHLTSVPKRQKKKKIKRKNQKKKTRSLSTCEGLTTLLARLPNSTHRKLAYNWSCRATTKVLSKSNVKWPKHPKNQTDKKQ